MWGHAPGICNSVQCSYEWLNIGFSRYPWSFNCADDKQLAVMAMCYGPGVMSRVFRKKLVLRNLNNVASKILTWFYMAFRFTCRQSVLMLMWGEICRKSRHAGRKLNLLARLPRTLSTEYKLMLFCSFIPAQFEYYAVGWHFFVAMKSLERIDKRSRGLDNLLGHLVVTSNVWI